MVTKPKALVVDDSRSMRVLLKKNIEPLGYEVLEAGDGDEALATLDALDESPLLMTIDWNMPGMNGLELTRAIRKQNKFDAGTIVIVSTETELKRVGECLLAGASEYIMKPFDADIFAAKLQLAGVKDYREEQPV